MITDKQWKELRKKYFDECTFKLSGEIKDILLPKVSMNPHDLFEWFKKEIEKFEYLNLQ